MHDFHANGRMYEASAQAVVIKRQHMNC